MSQPEGMPTDYLVSALVTLLVTVDPPGLAPTFLGLTQGMSEVQRRQVAVRASLIAGGILAASGLFGAQLLNALGIGLPAFRIAGGIMLFVIAFEMIFAFRKERRDETAEKAVTIDHVRNVAAFPLGIPLMAGPGAITATLLLSGRSEGNPLLLLALIGVIALVMFGCLVSFFTATKIARFLGVTGNILLTRLLGVVLAALAVQFVIDGVKAVV
jgi:multiple antibiotic resistance protein